MKVYNYNIGSLLIQLLVLQLCTVPVFSSKSLGETCGDDRDDVQGNITSPYHPGHYHSSTMCKWHIYRQSGKIITISFAKPLDIVGDEGNCGRYDYLQIAYDKSNDLYCGNDPERPIPIISDSSTDRITIVFNSNSDSDTGTGFFLQYFQGPAYAASCGTGQFHCQNDRCIPRDWTCNGRDECGDRSDEAVDVCHSTTAPPTTPTPTPKPSSAGPVTIGQCPTHTMFCLDRSGRPQCLPESKKCDWVSDCKDGEDEIGCESRCQHDLQQVSGAFSSPNYPGLYPADVDCSWTILIGEGQTVQLRFVSFSLEDKYSSDYVKVYDGTSVDSPIIGTYYGYNSSDSETSNHLPPVVIEASSNSLHVTFHSDSSVSSPGFNATYQTKGICLQDQKMCSACGFTEQNCFSPQEACDGLMTCIMGTDEMGCRDGCKANEVSCDLQPSKSRPSCYSCEDRCNGHATCSGDKDELNCSPLVCHAQNGTFLCGTGRCIPESWWCDTNSDCEDNSDEANCPMSTKVITAAVVGSTVCGLLLVAALSCTCKLYQLYHSDPHPPTHTSPLREIEDELMRREAPPSYTATMSSPHFDEAQRAFIESLQAAAQARQESRTSGGSNRSSQHGSASNGRNITSVSGQVPSSEVPPSPPSTENTSQNSNTIATSQNSNTIATSSFQTPTTNQQTPVTSVARSPALVDDGSSPYTEISDVVPQSQGGEDTSCCTTDTDSDTNAEVEREQRDQEIIRAAKNIRRMRLAGGLQTIVDSVTNRQREDALQQGGQEDARRRSSSGLQSAMERVHTSRENNTRQSTGPDSDDRAPENSSNVVAPSGEDVPQVTFSPEQQNSLNHSAVSSKDVADDGRTSQVESCEPSQSPAEESSSNIDTGIGEESTAIASSHSTASTPLTSNPSTEEDDLPLDISEADHHYATITDRDDEMLLPS